MSRPTRFCKKCGEYVVERHVSVRDPQVSGGWKTALKLVHIDANGEQIFRNHQAVEEVYA